MKVLGEKPRTEESFCSSDAPSLDCTSTGCEQRMLFQIVFSSYLGTYSGPNWDLMQKESASITLP